MSRTRRRTATVAVLALVAAFLVVPTAAHAAASGVVLVGRGYGHGHGMSQYGAQGRATAGHAYRDILAAYYPGTTLATGDDSAPIRVWIRSDTSGRTVVRAEPGLSVRTSAGAVTLPTNVGGQVTRWRARVASGRMVLEAEAGGTWRDHGSADLTALLDGTSTIEFRASDGTVQLHTGTVYREHRGSVIATRDPGAPSSVRSVVRIALGEYLKSVLPAEMPPSWHREANRAQAVAARTYAMWDRDVNKNSTWYDTCDTTQCQVYRGAADYNAAGVRTAVHEHASSTAAVDATAGRYLRYSGEPAFTQFSASNGGYSVAGSRPYLKASADPYDGYPQWTETLTAKRIETAYPAIGGFRSLSTTRDGAGPWGGRVTSVELRGTKGAVTVTGNAFRSALGLKSTLWTTASSAGLMNAQRDWNADAVADLIARGPDGHLYLYAGKGTAGWAKRQQIGRSWSPMRSMTQVHNLRGTGQPEVVAIHSSTGKLYVYPGTSTGSFGARYQAGHAWQGLDIVFGVNDWAGPGTVGLIARHATNGRLLYYPGNGTGGFGSARQIGRGWGVMDAIITAGDWDGDGKVDLIAREASTGLLHLYPGNGSGGFGTPRQIGRGWGVMEAVVGAADWNRDGNVDILAIDRATGRLWLYPGNGKGGFRSRVQVGSGWQGYEVLR